ncbi:salivary glue protein Sgs-3 [Biomphalaria glabrata]|nr:salivary glue protein Sgs-3 [Biomphalaria glabrata]
MLQKLLLLLLGVVLCSSQQVEEEIVQGSCKSVYIYTNYRNYCSFTNTAPTIPLVVRALQQYSTQNCVQGVTYGIQDSTRMWVSGLCYALFSISRVYPITTTTTPITTIATAAPTTLVYTTKAVVTNSTTNSTTATTNATSTTKAPTTNTTITANSTTATTNSTSTTKAPTTNTTTTANSTTPTTNSTTTTKAPTTNTTTTSTTSIQDICGVANSAFRIIGGTNATSCEFPWMVVLYNQVAGGLCGGFIIDSTHILTAAHCVAETSTTTKITTVEPAVNFVVFTGSSSIATATRRVVKSITAHEQYNGITLDKDIAIVTLSLPLNFTTCQRPLCLVNATSSPQNATRCKVMGWGVTSTAADASISTNLQWVDVPIVNDTSCRSLYGSYFSATNFCAGTLGKDSCQGDSGGPLACRENDGKYYVQGIVSGGFACGQTAGLYTKVSSFIPWIQSKITLL